MIIESSLGNNQITVYPYPANDHTTIDCGILSNVSGYQIKVINMLGQEVLMVQWMRKNISCQQILGLEPAFIL